MNINPNSNQAISPQPRPRSGRDPLSRLIIQAVQAVTEMPASILTGVGVAVGAGLGLALGAYSGFFTSPTTDLTRAIRSQDGASSPSEPTNASAFNTTNDTADTNQTDTAGASGFGLGSQANLDAILEAAGYLNETTDETNEPRRVVADLLFSDPSCEEAVLSAIFMEAETTQDPVESATTATPSTTTIDPIAQQTAENATIWQSELSTQRQVLLNQEQFDAALGAALTPSNETDCPVRLFIDPSTLPEVEEREITQLTANQVVDEALNQPDNIHCAPVIPTETLTGRDMQGNQIFRADLNACSRSNISEPLQSAANTAQRLNMTESQIQELRAQIEQIRYENCPENITLIDGAWGGVSGGSAAFNDSLAEIQRLCPNISVTPLSQVNTSITSALLGPFGLAQLLESIGLQNLTQDIILLTGEYNTLTSGFDFTSLLPAIEYLLSQGVQLFSTEPNAWSDLIPGFIADVNIAEALVRSRGVRLAREATNTTEIPTTTNVTSTTNITGVINDTTSADGMIAAGRAVGDNLASEATDANQPGSGMNWSIVIVGTGILLLVSNIYLLSRIFTRNRNTTNNTTLDNNYEMQSFIGTQDTSDSSDSSDDEEQESND